MQSIRRRDTKPELALRAALRLAGLFGYRVDFSLPPARADIAFIRCKLAVFVHGCFWHRCPNCALSNPKHNPGYWERKFELAVDRDERNRRYLEARGWEVLELWECEITRDVAACADQVASACLKFQLHLEVNEELAELSATQRVSRNSRLNEARRSRRAASPGAPVVLADGTVAAGNEKR